ncbi:MAG TPA: peptidase S1, partial [Chloroflexi bacterium]|nr:peptidase S1 [Chloroflexota bacterium]
MNVEGRIAGLTTTLAEALADVAQRVQHSLVLVQSGPRGSGSGIIWRPNGVVVTNHHVVAHGRPRITLADDREFAARVVVNDPEADLAVLQLDALGLPAVTIGDSRHLRVGQLVLAVGNPWGQRGLVTAGVVSGLGETAAQGTRRAVPYIRSDVGLAPGNSGGPLVDATGAVIGINSMIVGGDLSVAIPSHVAGALVADALDRRVILGVGVRPVPLPATIRGQIGAAQAAGLLVVELAPNGPADRA